MVRIVVFDSGLGSLSIINAIQKICKSEIIYFADQKNFPYGNKSKKELTVIIKQTIKLLEKNFSPDLIVMASNTPSLMIKIKNKKLIGVYPPIKEAMKISKTKNIAVLGTKTAIVSKSLSNYIKKFNFSKEKKIYKINSSQLVELVESNKFITSKSYCRKIIKKTLNKISKNQIDTATLSSTHLSFLKPQLNSEFPQVHFVDPAEIVANNVLTNIKKNKSKKNTIKIFTSGDVTLFQNNLYKLGIRNKVNFLST
ncbi:MAG: aspartate/glutamate racemase family protein [Nitrosarchaeum sp.]|jgi:glutamate racemase|uniref:glutamate racemase n=1 Tax=Nitrosarchaeum sp. TaxID=2026886 RepID=UPI002DF6842E|nr:aspartate/glutamate racemase family protein [Nitrosarchaeum sp.]MEC4848960.1 aspartate/glutamate racemase family protein [Nitrosarchaeum sp.]